MSWLVLSSCSHEDSGAIRLELIAGKATSAFTDKPAVEKLKLRTISPDGRASDVLFTAWPDKPFTLTGISRNQLVAFEALGLDAGNRVVVRGASAFHALWRLSEPSQNKSDATIPIFAARVQQITGAPGFLPIAHQNGIAALVDGRYVMSVGGSEARNDRGEVVDPAIFCVYDVARWEPTTITSKLPRVPKSLVMIGAQHALAFDEKGATKLDLYNYHAEDVPFPPGASASEVAGGQVVYGIDGYSYVVGPTRQHKESSVVIVVDSYARMSVVRLASPRKGVAAAYVPSKGLVIAAGHATEPSVVVIPPGTDNVSVLAYPPDATVGATLIAMNNNTVLLAAGRDEKDQISPVRAIDLRCSSNCQPKVLGNEPVGVDVQYAKGYVLDSDQAVLVGQGSEPEAPTQLYILQRIATGLEAKQIQLLHSRTGATSIALFGRTIAIIGGKSLQSDMPSDKQSDNRLGLEMFVPQ